LPFPLFLFQHFTKKKKKEKNAKFWFPKFVFSKCNSCRYVLDEKRAREMDGFMNQMNAIKQKQLEKFALRMQNAMLTKVGLYKSNPVDP
jgi:hypothetical protein